MRAISLWQPWASLWLSPAKVHETRHWATRHRGQLLVHAARTREGWDDLDDDLAAIVIRELGGLAALPYGALIGIVDLLGCFRMPLDGVTGSASADDVRCGNWSPGRYAWRRGPVVKLFDQPIPYAGRQTLFEVPDAVLSAVAA